MSTKPHTDSAGPISAAMVAAVEKTCASIRRRHPDVPPVVVSVGQGMTVKEAKLGHFAAGAWQYDEDQVSELFLGGENLQADTSTVLITLLHEAAHGIAHTRQIKDTSGQGRYHNNKYRTLAVEVGLKVTQHPQLGWTLHDALPEPTAKQYRADMDRLAAALVAHRRTFSRTASDGRKDNNNGITAAAARARSEPNAPAGPPAHPLRRLPPAVPHRPVARPVAASACSENFPYSVKRRRVSSLRCGPRRPSDSASASEVMKYIVGSVQIADKQ
jgi:hypothetical protein